MKQTISGSPVTKLGFVEYSFDTQKPANTAASQKLFHVSNSTATITRQDSMATGDVDDAVQGSSWQRNSLDQASGAEPREKRSWLLDVRQPVAATRHSDPKINIATPVESDSTVEMAQQNTPAPVRSGKIPKRDSVAEKAGGGALSLIFPLAAWKGLFMEGIASDSQTKDLQKQCKTLRGEKKALTNSLWKRWFSPKHRRAAAVLQKTLNVAESSILEALTMKNTVTNLFGNALATLLPGVTRNETLPEELSAEELASFLTPEPPLAELERILTREWCDACPGLAALATQVAKVRAYQDELKQQGNDNAKVKNLRELKAETKNRVRLANDAYKGVPSHLREFVKQEVLKPAGLEKFVGLRAS